MNLITITPPEFSDICEKTNLDILKGKSGIYILVDKDGKNLYVGKSIDLHIRMYKHIKSRTTSLFKRFVYGFKYFEVDNPVDLEIYETYLINELKPPFNSSKVYVYNSNYLMHKYLLKEETERIAKHECRKLV
jgi:excinuclease UvrABC nuclease subunit